jgi:hypothetical protein
VDADVGLLQQQHAGDAEAGAEGVEVAGHRGRAGGVGGGAQQGLDGGRVAQAAGRDAVEIGQQMAAAGQEGAHLWPPRTTSRCRTSCCSSGWSCRCCR